MYMRPFTTSRMITVRLPPPVLPGGISGSTSPHSSSVRSLGYRNLLRSYRARFLLVHISGPSSNQATTVESQVIHMIQVLFGQTLREINHLKALTSARGCPAKIRSLSPKQSRSWESNAILLSSSLLQDNRELPAGHAPLKRSRAGQSRQQKKNGPSRGG